MASQTPKQKKIVGRVMHEFKQGDLPSGSGDKVRNPRQAIAIALNEAGASRRQRHGESHMNKNDLLEAPAKRRAYSAAQGRPVPRACTAWANAAKMACDRGSVS